MNQAAHTQQSIDVDGNIAETPWEEVDNQLKKLDAALAAVKGADVPYGVAEKSSIWQSPWMMAFHVLMVLPLAFEIYYLTHPLMFQR